MKSNIKSEKRSFKSNENIHKKDGGSYYVVSANKAIKPSREPNNFNIISGHLKDMSSDHVVSKSLLN